MISNLLGNSSIFFFFFFNGVALNYSSFSQITAVHSWNRTTCQTPSTRNYRLTAVFKITRQTVVSENMRLTAVFTKVYRLTAVLKTPGRRYFPETGAWRPFFSGVLETPARW